MQAIRSFEMSVNFYRNTQLREPEINKAIVAKQNVFKLGLSCLTVQIISVTYLLDP
jgi:hypothetical protein